MISIPDDPAPGFVAEAMELMRTAKEAVEWRGVIIDLRHPKLKDREWLAATLMVAPLLPGHGSVYASWAQQRNQAFGGPRDGVRLDLGDCLSVKGCRFNRVGDKDAPGDVLALAWDRDRVRLFLTITSANGEVRDVPGWLTLVHPLMMREVQTPRTESALSGDLAGQQNELYSTHLRFPSIELMHQRLLALGAQPGVDPPRSGVTAQFYFEKAMALLSVAHGVDGSPAWSGDLDALTETIAQVADQAAAFGYMQAQAEFEAGPRSAALSRGKLQGGGMRGGQAGAVTRAKKAAVWQAWARPRVEVAARDGAKTIEGCTYDVLDDWNAHGAPKEPGLTSLRTYISGLVKAGMVKLPQ